MTWRSRPGYCAFCSDALFKGQEDVVQTVATDSPEFAWQQWVTYTLGAVVAQLPVMSVEPKRERIRQVVRYAVERLADGNIGAFAQLLGMSANTVKNWCQGKRIPEMDMLLRLCYRLDLSLKEVGQRLGYQPTTLYKINQTACYAIAERFTAYRRELREKRLQGCASEIRQIALYLQTERSAYWQAKGFLWRTEPEIDEKRQRELSQRRAIIPDIKQGISPFKGMKLSRADVEWLLTTHENGCGPVDWGDENQRARVGLDLRGTDLRYVDLHSLPLARTCLGIAWNTTTSEWLEEASLHQSLPRTYLARANFNEAHLEGANLSRAFFEDVYFVLAHLEDANLSGAHLEGARLIDAHLQKANLTGAHLERAILSRTHLEYATLRGAYFDGATLLENITLGEAKGSSVSVADIHWGDANLTSVTWLQIQILGDEYEARQKKCNGKVKGKDIRLEEHGRAARANRQLAVALQTQGLNEDATRFAYRAQVLQRKVLWQQRSIGKWLFSLLLALLAGYGYRMGRILIAYLLIISVCAVAYFVLGMYYTPHLSLIQAFLESITAFHGRVFLELFATNTPQIWVTAFEAVTGLLIEGVFIAMLTQRFFGK